MDLNRSLFYYINNPRNDQICFNVGLAYDLLGQKSSALTFFLKTLDHTKNIQLQYECLLKCIFILEDLGRRDTTVKTLIHRAIALMPDRAEAYCLLGRVYERKQNWVECYSNATLALKISVFGTFKSDLDFPGKEELLFQKALSSWWIGNFQESLYLMRNLAQTAQNDAYLNLSKHNISILQNLFKFKSIKYTQDLAPYLKYKFNNFNFFKTNYSECFQDIFVLMCTNGKSEGTFIELGCNHPRDNNNTFLLESEFNWHGLSVDINSDYKTLWASRRADTLWQDARFINWDNILKQDHYDYLQLDCDPSFITLDILYKIPFHRCSFSVITFEHDYYIDLDDTVRSSSREYLKSFGYELIIPNVSLGENRPFEDWYVLPSTVNPDAIKLIKTLDRDYNNILNRIFSF